ncbi:FliI/YscN family ATPase [Altererythrobacter sp. Z27]|uniref:FliI/YscN family ATPase n=1 Tax=Altererythrobacter sp. Z27 TaxID=3461147 RepID=UPI004044F799
MTDQNALAQAIRSASFAQYCGEVVAVGQGWIRANGPISSVGEFCQLGAGDDALLAEVVAVDEVGIRLLPLGPVELVRPGTQVRKSPEHSAFRSGAGFAGRAVDAFGRPIDGGKAIAAAPHRTDARTGVLNRTIIADRLATGFSAIDGLLPIAIGQRIGIFAAAGVGKTTLVEQLSHSVACDRVVLCLIGERGREVEQLWSAHEKGARAGHVALVAATSDDSPSVRVRAIYQALALCEEWRSRGEHVVLFVDSVTRLAIAMREIGLAAGEVPSVRSYTPNVFAALPAVIERCGAIKGSGAITAVFTILSETDDVDDPIVETMKSILDGHIVLSRRLAEKGHFPAIDIAASVSRTSDRVLEPQALKAAQSVRRNFAVYQESRDMIESGIYQSGSNPEIDRAVRLQSEIADFLRQHSPFKPDLASVDRQLGRLAELGETL